MTKAELKDLLTRASQAVDEFAGAIDTQLYRLGSYYGNKKEQETRDLANELERAAVELDP